MNPDRTVNPADAKRGECEAPVKIRRDCSACDNANVHETEKEKAANTEATAENAGLDEETVSGGGFRFEPPLYVQRYGLVREILQQNKVKSVVDFGCAECKFVRWLKELNTVEHIWLVDVDGSVLRTSTMLIRPLTYEYLVRRQQPLTITMLQGSAADLDCQLIGCEAVTMVEVIEHLEADVLKAVTENVFGRLRPGLVVITTPNAEFNAVFPGFSGFRHWDHKFEWTRQEFQNWCESVRTKHGYSVTYTGVGDPPTHMSHVGHCSQAAIFTEAAGKPGLQEAEQVYGLVAEAVYPYDERSHRQKLASEVDYQVRQFAMMEEYQVPDSCDQAVVPRERILSSLSSTHKQQWQTAEINDYLQQTYRLSDDGDSVVINLPGYSSSDSSCESNHGDIGEEMTANAADRQEELVPSDSELWG
ncbi:hypothetical protein BaRGS_00004339 [Batillaria attramentaria]|uniref:Small RNA 2'-O-methyltransferase n=1 Tax=Batillaria attramentaria TaxID=370345 RepID=A0ABD0LYD9_9CAEN